MKAAIVLMILVSYAQPLAMSSGASRVVFVRENEIYITKRMVHSFAD